MNDTDTRALKDYLAIQTAALEYARERVECYAQREVLGGTELDRTYYGGLRKYHEGQVTAYDRAIADLRECFETELTEAKREPDEEPCPYCNQTNYHEDDCVGNPPAHRAVNCRCPEFEDGRGDREHETRRDAEIDKESPHER
jgi:hypothetical protein